jgi:membrane protease YdiL (CAAX protease family)
MRKFGNRSEGLWLFFVLTYAIMLFSWGSMALFQIPGASASQGSALPNSLGILLFALGGFSPSIAGIAATWRVAGREGLKELWRRALRFKLGWSSYLVILLLPIVILGLRLGIQVARGGSFLESPFLTRPLSLVGFTIAMILGGAVSEEFGWRGFALDRLLDRRGLGTANVILGIVWAFWHLPLFFIPGTTQATRGNVVVEFTIFAVWIVGLAVLFSWLHIRTGRSLFAAILFHATINWSNSFAGTLIRPELIDQMTNTVAIALFAIVVSICWTPIRRPSAGNPLRSA